MYCLTACKSKYYFSNRQIFAIFLFIYRSEILAGTIVGSLLVHTEGVPCCRTEDVLILDIVHAYRYAEDRTECQQVGTDMSVGDGTVVGSPAVHH